MSRTPTLPPTEPAMWRKLLARVHPDSNGEFDTSLSFDELTIRALSIAASASPLYADLLMLLEDCKGGFIGPLYDQQRRGASYKQLAAIAHQVGMTKDQRIGWYRVVESIPLSMRHAGHVLSQLKEGAA